MEKRMKQTNSLLWVFVLLALLLSACNPQSTATGAVATQPPASDEVATQAPPTEVVPAATPMPVLEGTIAISGAFALYPMMTLWGEEFQKIHPDVQFDISAGGAGKGMTDALSGAVDIGMVSRAVKPEEVSQGAYAIPVVKDAVFPVVNANNPVIADLLATGLTKDVFRKIFITGEIKTWGEAVGRPEITDAIHVFTRSDSCGAADIWAQYMGGKGQADIAQGIGVNADPGLLEAVQKDSLGIGYNNLSFAFDQTNGQIAPGAAIVPLDANENGVADPDEVIDALAKATAAVANGTYPMPPARLENLVTNGKPTGLTRIFIEWILTDGQQFVGQAGYVQLSADQLAESLAKVR